MNNLTKTKVVSGLIWKLLERLGSQGLQFIITIILARLLTPSDYGTVALITIFISVANVFVTNGITTALIQKMTIDDTDSSSVFYFNLIVSILLYCILYISAPMIAMFFNQNILINVIRLLGLTLILGAIIAVQSVIVIREMSFKKYFISSLLSVIGSAFIGIYMAYHSYGVWALVFSQLSNNFILSMVLWFTVKWRPKMKFSLERIKYLYIFGLKVLYTSLISVLTDNLYGLLIGKIYSREALGYFNKGNQFPYILTNNVNGAISTVLLPVMSKHQDDKDRLKSLLRHSIRTSSYIMFPLIIALAVMADPLVRILLTDKWLPVVFFIQISCLKYFVVPLQTTNVQALYAVGRSDITMKLEVIKSILSILFLIVSIPFGIYVMAIMRALISLMMLIFIIFPSKKMLDYSCHEMWEDIRMPLILSLIMGITSFMILVLIINIYLSLFLQILVALIIYLGLSFLLKIDSFQFIINAICELKIERNSK